MKRVKILPDLMQYPAAFRGILQSSTVYDSSCSPEARVIFIDRDGGCFLKSAAAGSLAAEATMTSYFYQKGLGAAVLSYLTEDGRDWLLTARVPGEDCTHAAYLDDPARLCDLLATRLRALHELDAADCPVQNRTSAYLEAVDEGYRTGRCDLSYLLDGQQLSSADEAWRYVQEHCGLLRADTLLHGDYCLPNIMLDNWRFSGFIDVGNGGVGDRHIDLFWGAWTLCFNLKTDAYRTRFFDAYGRDKIEPQLLRVVAAAEVFG
ncbi:MAG: aminoglycoside 3'-phosphotransferase [Clostridia bacterium]|nr:aminoglycoside 3'-phosphotransferase [Clostridia bacterium]